MFATVLLALLTSAPLAPAAAPSAGAAQTIDRWETFTANPKWEVYGHEEGGRFLYSNRRLKIHGASGPSVGFGVDLPTPPPSPAATAAPSIMGTDAEAAAIVVHAAEAAKEAQATAEAESTIAETAGPVCGHSDCNGGRCNRRPRPPIEVPVHVDGPKLPNLEPVHVAFVCIGLFITCVIVFVFFVALALLWKLFRHVFLTTTAPSAEPIQ